jgi:uncharacterized protein (DUF4415 family)
MNSSQKLKNLEEDQDFMSLFNGKYEISGTGKGWQDALDWLGTGEVVYKKVMTCLMLFVHPLRYVEAGLVKRANGAIDKAEDGFNGYDKALISYLPVLDNLESVKNEYRRSATFGKVNFTMVKRVSLMALEVLPRISVIEQWIKKNKGRPSSCPLPTDDSESSRITKDVLLAFRAEYKDYVDKFATLLKA